MAEVATFRIEGLDEIERRLQRLPEKVRRKHVKKTLDAGAKIFREEAVSRVPRRKPASGWLAFVEEPGPHLKDNIVVKITVGKNGATARIGIDYKKVRHGHLLEFGHRIVLFKTDTGRRTRKYPFMRPAYDAKVHEVMNLLKARLAKAVETEARTL